MHPFRLDGVHGIQEADGVHLMFRSLKIKSHSLFQVENNKISQDEKGLFLGVRSRVSVISLLGCSSRTSCMSR